MGMRSPWKLIKDLASRRKAEAAEPADELVAIPDPQGEELRQELTPQPEIEAPSAIKFKSTAGENPANRQPDSVGAAAVIPVQVEQSDFLLAEPVKGGGLEGHDQPSPAAPAIRAAEAERGAGVLEGGPKKQREKAARARTNLQDPPIARRALKEPAAVKKTLLDEATELDLEIKDLRSQLSAKLFEQNAQLRRMLERYDDK
jgi:hypothetical protein